MVSSLNAKTLNGFDLDQALVPASQILSGGPPRDGIPAIDKPHFITAKKASFMRADELVIGVHFNGITKAYPVRILNWHEIVNDHFEQQRIVITYCPLCGTGVAFKVDNIGLFGVSGLLYNSDVLLYDRKTQSLWSQLLMKAIAGPLKGQKLNVIALEYAHWDDWKKRNPDTLVLSTQTGFDRDYNRDPYLGYASTNRLYFPVNNTDNRYHKKEWVIGVELNGQHKAYPFSELQKTSSNPIIDDFQQQKLYFYFNKTNKTVTVTDNKHNLLPTIQAYWFAWMAFHPDSTVFTAD